MRCDAAPAAWRLHPRPRLTQDRRERMRTQMSQATYQAIAKSAQINRHAAAGARLAVDPRPMRAGARPRWCRAIASTCRLGAARWPSWQPSKTGCENASFNEDAQYDAHSSDRHDISKLPRISRCSGVAVTCFHRGQRSSNLSTSDKPIIAIEKDCQCFAGQHILLLIQTPFAILCKSRLIDLTSESTSANAKRG